MIRNLKYATPDRSIIDLELNHPEYGWIPFTANPDDPEVHGRVIHALALTAEYGPIAPYDGPSEETLLAEKARSDRNYLLAGVDAVVTNPLIWKEMSEEEQGKWSEYRQALLDVPQQFAFPHDIDWPEKP